MFCLARPHRGLCELCFLYTISAMSRDNRFFLSNKQALFHSEMRNKIELKVFFFSSKNISSFWICRKCLQHFGWTYLKYICFSEYFQHHNLISKQLTRAYVQLIYVSVDAYLMFCFMYFCITDCDEYLLSSASKLFCFFSRNE